MKVITGIILLFALSVVQAVSRRRGLSKGGKGKGDKSSKKSASPTISLSPSSAPSISATPSVSSEPSFSSLPSHEPSMSAKPSFSPSESLAPSQSLAPSCGSKKGKGGSSSSSGKKGGEGGRRLSGKGKGGSSKYNCDEDLTEEDEEPPVDLEGDDPLGTPQSSGGTANFADATSTNSLEASLPSSSAASMKESTVAVSTIVSGALAVAAVMM